MKIYTNRNYEIIGIDSKSINYDHLFEIEQTREELFGKWCDTCIRGYKYEPQYEMLFKEDGNHERDKKNGELLYKLDGDGNKIFIGYACYPYIDINTLMLIQKQYEDSQRQLQALNAQIEYLSMMSGVETEVGHE